VSAGSTSIEFRASFGRKVTNPAGEFNNALMDLDANGACRDIVVMLELAENLLLNLHVVFHDLRPPIAFVTSMRG
jgi:hypothetical protein